MVGPGVLGGRVKRGVGSNVSLLGAVGWTEVRVGALVGLNVGIGSVGESVGGRGIVGLADDSTGASRDG